jgi:hypothetical protein
MDVEIVNHGSLYGFRPVSQAARDWIAENVSDDAQWFGGALMVEHRYASDLAEGMAGDGLELG